MPVERLPAAGSPHVGAAIGCTPAGLRTPASAAACCAGAAPLPPAPPAPPAPPPAGHCTLQQTVHLSTAFDRAASPFSTVTLPAGRATWHICAGIAAEPGNADAVAWSLQPTTAAAGAVQCSLFNAVPSSRVNRTGAVVGCTANGLASPAASGACCADPAPVQLAAAETRCHSDVPTSWFRRIHRPNSISRPDDEALIDAADAVEHCLDSAPAAPEHSALVYRVRPRH